MDRFGFMGLMALGVVGILYFQMVQAQPEHQEMSTDEMSITDGEYFLKEHITDVVPEKKEKQNSDEEDYEQALKKEMMPNGGMYDATPSRGRTDSVAPESEILGDGELEGREPTQQMPKDATSTNQ